MSGRRAVAGQGVATGGGGGWGRSIIVVLVLTLGHVLNHLHLSLRCEVKEISINPSVKNYLLQHPHVSVARSNYIHSITIALATKLPPKS